MTIERLRLRWRGRDEAGIYLILYAVLMMVLIAIAALVLDLSALRNDRREGRTMVDAAAAAGALELARAFQADDACDEAWRYVLANRTDRTGTIDPPNCSPLSGSCDSSTGERVRTGRAGPYSVKIVHPVPDSSVYMVASLAGGDRSQATSGIDGLPCERFAVEITRERALSFASALGMARGTTTLHAVARAGEVASASADLPALVALRNAGCPAIYSHGYVIAKASTTKPGLIFADSLGTGASCATGYVFDATSSGRIAAESTAAGVEGRIGFVSSIARGYNPPAAKYIGTLTQLEEQTTREPVDRAYHCGAVLGGCRPPYTASTDGVADLLYPLNGPGIPLTTPGYFPYPSPLDTCNPAAPIVFPPGNWYIDCPVFTVTTAITFSSGNVVVNGALDVGANGTLTVNQSAALPAILAVRGALSTSANTAVLSLPQTTVYQTGTATARPFSINNGTFTWTAPLSGPLKDLLYWNESGGTIAFQGNPVLNGDGVWFAPKSLVDLQGAVTVNLTNVQMWVSHMSLANASARIELSPNPARSIAVTGRGTKLIR